MAASKGCGQRFASLCIVLGMIGFGIYSCNSHFEAVQKVEDDRLAKLTPEQRAAEVKAAAEAKVAKDREVEIERLKIEAGSACKHYVRDCLRFPGDASFPWLGCDVTSNKEGDVFACEGTVKAKNGFGAELTYRWAAIVYLDDNTWRLVHLTLHGDTMVDHPELIARIKAKHGETPGGKAETAVSKKALKSLPAETKPAFRESDYRTWTDTKGHTVEAAFVLHKGANVTLHKRDGKDVTLSIFKLSDDDREWIRQRDNQR